MINLIKHGETRDHKIKVNHGKVSYWKREKYCARHGWIDLFMIGGEIQWQRTHSKCDRHDEAGASFDLKIKVMRKAA